MDNHALSREVLRPYAPAKPTSKRKEEITPWSFYHDNSDTKNFLESHAALGVNEKAIETKPLSRKVKSHNPNAAARRLKSKQKRAPTKASEPNPEVGKPE